jgi:hypothetical protein
LPLAFEPNRGQADPRIRFVARGRGYTISLRSTEASFALGATGRIGMRLVSGNRAARLLAQGPLPGKVNYLLGNDHSKWLTGVPTYARLVARDVYPGVDVAYYGRQNRFEYDLIVRPGASASAISLQFAGARGLRLLPNGDLNMRLAGSHVRQLPPQIYQRVDDTRRRVEGRFVLRGDRVGFALGRYDHSRPLVIDPALAYSTYLGGIPNDSGSAIAVDASGSAYVAGWTESQDFPTVNPVQPSIGDDFFGYGDVFVSKLNPAGTALVYSTYLGGKLPDAACGIAVDAAGNAYLTGYTESANFPTASPLQASKAGGSEDAFVSKLNAAGNGLVYSTYLGGSGDTGEFGWAIAVDPSGNAYVTGTTTSPNFPTVNPLQPTLNGALNGGDAFVSKLNAAGTALVYSTYLGGSGGEQGFGIAVDSAGSAYVAGDTLSTDFPTANPLQAAKGGGYDDAFVSKLNPAGNALVYSTYLGGSGSEFANGVALDSAGDAYLTGNTDSTNFPIVSPLQAANAGGVYDAFVSKVNAGGSALVYSTYLGGSDDENNRAIAVDADGSAYITGFTNSTDFPTANPIQAANAGPADAYVSKVSPAGTALVYSTYLGGSGGDAGDGIAVDSAGSAYVIGDTGSTNFPTAHPLQAANRGCCNSTDIFITKIADHPTVVSLRGFTASRRGRAELLRWRTGSDSSLLGFNLYREQSGNLVKLNRALIRAASGGAVTGHTYAWLDRAPPNRRTTYRLQAVSLSGQRSWIGTLTTAK